ncbi:MAG: metallophosphoesterase [Eubacteriales bacterium]
MVIGIVIVGIFLVIILVVTVIGILKSRKMCVVSYEIPSDKVEKSIHMVLLADLHNREYGEKNCELLESIRNVQPELIVVAGDFMVAKGCDSIDELQVALDFTRKLVEICPVYYANGNHEHSLKRRNEQNGLYTQYIELLRKAHVVFLENDSILLEEFGIRITGLDLPRDYYRRILLQKMQNNTLDTYLGHARQDVFQILIAHNPEYFPEYSKWGADLTLSGHIHGGIMRLPYLGGVLSPSLHLFPKYDGGLFRQDGRFLVLSRGIGMHTIPIRIYNPPEIVSIRIKKE